MIVEVHCHPFGPPAYRDLRDKIRSVPDLIGFRRNHPELYRARDTEPLVDYVDEIAGRYPEVPIVLTKMGRAIQHYFESALIVAMRNPNVYFDTTSTTTEHLRRAVETIGADRIMFGTDWSPTWRCVEEPEPLYPARLKVVLNSGIPEEDVEWVLWKTAVELYGL